MQDAMPTPSSESVNDGENTDVMKEIRSSPSSPSYQTDEKTISQLQTSFMADNSESDEDEVSEVESFLIDQGEYEEGRVIDSKFLLSSDSPNSITDCAPCTDLRNVDPVTQAKLAALLEAAGLGKLSTTADGKQYTDPEVLRKLTSSVSSALDEAAAALNRMRAENSGSHSSEGSLAEACSDGDVKAVMMLLDEGHSNVNETTEEGESLLSFACSSGYFEMARMLLAKKANVDDRGIKGDCTPLMGAASGGHVDIVKLLLAHGADVNAQSQSGNTPLMCACAGGYEEVVSVLLQSGANVEDHNENGHTPLMEAASAGHVPVAKILLEHGAGINTHSNEFKESALTLACYKGHLEMVRFLLEAGADQEHKTDEMHTALMEASMDGHVEVARLLLDSGAQVNMPADSFESPLTLAACGGHVDLAMLLLERGANIEEVNDEGYTPLMEASREGHEEMVALLLSQGADINAQTEETQETALTLACCGGFLEVADFLIKAGANIELGASSPLMEAAQEGHLELVRYLLDAGSKVNAPTATGDTALTYACENGHTDVADLLLQAGAHLEHESEGGRTPLMKSARSGHLCTVQFLISRGADINRRTSNNDHTPLSLACAGGHLAVVELLLAHGSDPSHKLKDNSTMLIEAAKGGHTNVVQLLLDYPNSMLASPPPPPPPASADGLPGIGTSSLDQNLEPPRVPPHGLQVVQSEAPVLAIPKPNAGVSTVTASQPYLHNMQPGITDTLHLQQNSPQISGIQPPNIRQNIPAQRSFLRNVNSNSPTKPCPAPGTSNVMKQDAALMTPQLVQLIKNCQQQAAMVNVASELSYDFEKSFVEGVNNAAAVAAVGMGLDVSASGDDKDLLPSERLEACINSMMKKAEMMHHNREEQILQKQQILEELQRVERELQEKAQTQLLLNAQYRIDQIQQNMSSQSNGGLYCNQVLDETIDLPLMPSQITFGANLENLIPSLPEENILPVTSSPNVITSTSPSAAAAPGGVNAPVDVLRDIKKELIDECERQIRERRYNFGNPDGGTQWVSGSLSSASEAKNQNNTVSELSTSESAFTPIHSTSNKVATKPENVATGSPVASSAPSTVPMSSLANTVSSPCPNLNKSKSKKQQNKYHLNMGLDTCSLLSNLPDANPAGVMGSIGGNSGDPSTVPYPAILQTATLASAPVAIVGGNTVGTPTLTMTTSMLSPNLGGASQFIAAESDELAGVGGLMVASPARTLHDTLADDSSVPMNQVAANAKYDPPAFTNNPPPPQVQTAMSLSAQGLLPKTSSCSVATQCMVDSCLDSQTDSNHETALTFACAGGHEELVTLLLQRGANIEHREKKGFTPLILAATAGHAGVVEILLNNMAEIETQTERTKDTPLSLACSSGRYEVVEILLARGANKEHRNVSDYTPLSLAASGGYVNIIKLLLSHGAEINSRSGSKLGISPLMLAAMNGHTAAVKLLLDMGSDINAQIETNRNTSLTLACFQGRHEVVSLLVDRKANIEHRAKTGLTPLMEAASGGYTEVGQVLLDKGADVNASPVPSSRDTALTIAADKGHYRFVELLLSRGAAVDVKNKKGNSPLWLSCNGGHLDVVQLLVSVGADIDSQDNRKVSCLMAAFRKGHIKVVKWMVKHVAQFPSDQECTRYIATISDKEILKKCHQCMEIIRTAKDRQEAEANKNASILLEELDMEKSREESKKAAAARRRERKRLKRKEKQAVKDLDTKEETENIKNENKNTSVNVNKVEVPQPIVVCNAPILPPGVTLTPIKVGETLQQKREEKNTVSIMKIETTSSTSEPMVTNMGTVIVVETKSSTISHMDQTKSSARSQSMITISRINSNTVTVSSSRPESNLVSISASSSAKPTKLKITKIEDIPIKVSDKLPVKDKSKELKKQDKQSKEKQSNKENKPATKEKTKSQVIVAVSCSATTSTTATLTAVVPRLANTTTKTTLTTSNKNNKKKEEKVCASSRRKDASSKEEKIVDSPLRNDLVIEPLSTTGIGDLDDFGSLPDNHARSTKNNKAKLASPAISTLNAFSDLPIDVHELDTITDTSSTLRSPSSLVVNSTRPALGHSPNSSASPKKGHKKEDGWKEVVRRSKKVSVPSNAISRVIGRGGCNINAIREVSGAHIEVEKQRGAGDRTIIIRGSAEATRQAHQLITALIKDPDRELLEFLPKATAAAITSKNESRNAAIGVSTSKSVKNLPLPTSMSVYSTPPFPATSSTKLSVRPGIPTTSLGNVGAAFQSTQSWPAFSSPMASSITGGSAKKSFNDVNTVLKSPAARQLFPDALPKTISNQNSTSVSHSVVSYTTAAIATGKNTKTVTTVNTSMSVHDYGKNNQPPPRMMNQIANSSAFENMTQFKPMINGPLRTSTMPQSNSNSSSGSSGSPIAQDYSPFNSIFSKVAQQSVWGTQRDGTKGMNFASVAASGVVSLAPTNPSIGPLHQSLISSPSPNSAPEVTSDSVDVAKAPGYRGSGSHMSPGSNSTESNHYSAPNTPPVGPIGTPSHNVPIASQASPAAPSPSIQTNSLQEKHQNMEKAPLTVSLASPAGGISIHTSSVRASALPGNASDKPHITNVPSAYMTNGISNPPNSGILSIASRAPGGPITNHAPVNLISSLGGQPQMPHQQGLPMHGQSVYTSRFVPPTTLANMVYAQNAVNAGLASSNNSHYPSNNIIQSNLNPNAPDFSSRSNAGNIMHPNIPPRMQLQNYMDTNLTHQSAFRPPLIQNPSFPQQNSSGFPNPPPTSMSRMPLFPPPSGIPLDYVTGLTPEAAAAAIHLLNANRQQNLSNVENNYSHLHNMPTHDNNLENDQSRGLNANNAPDVQSAQSSNSNVQSNQMEDRKSFPRPIGTERAHRKTPVFCGVSDAKGIWAFNNSDSNPGDWMNNMSSINTNSSSMMSMNNDDSKLPLILPNGNVIPNFHNTNAGPVMPPGRMNVLDNLSGDGAHHVDQLHQGAVTNNQSNQFNSMPMGGPSYLKNMPPNVVAAMMNQHLYNNTNSLNGPSGGDAWVSNKMPNSASNVNYHSSPASSQPEQKPMWNNEWNSQSKV